MKTRGQVFKSEAGRKAILDYYFDLLADLQIDHRQVWVDTPQGRTHLIEAGPSNGEPLLLLHGSCSNSAMWFGDLPILAQHFRVLAVDIPGEPGPSEGNRLDQKNDEHTEWLHHLLEQLDLPQVILIGNSFGGWLSLRFATAYPDRVSRMILIAASGLVPARLGFVIKSVFFVLQGQSGFDRMNRMLYAPEEIRDDVKAASQLIFDHFNPMLGGLPVLSDDQLGRLEMPILYLAGETDVTADVQKAARRLSRCAPKVTIRLIPDHGHVIYNAMADQLPFLLGN